MTPQESINAAWPWIVAGITWLVSLFYCVSAATSRVEARMRKERADGEAAVIKGLRQNLRQRDFYLRALEQCVDVDTRAQVERYVAFYIGGGDVSSCQAAIDTPDAVSEEVTK